MRKKLSDRQLWDCLNASAGGYAEAAEFAKERYNISISRISIRARALRDPDQLALIGKITLNEAENGLRVLMKSSSNEMVKLKAITFYLETKGKEHGWSKNKEIKLGEGLSLSVNFIDTPTTQEKVINALPLEKLHQLTGAGNGGAGMNWL